MTLLDDLRLRARNAVGYCACCGRPIGSTRATAKLIGVPHSTLARFLRGGEPSGRLVDTLDEWLTRLEADAATTYTR